MVQNASIIKWQKIYFDNRERLFLLELITSFLCWSKIQHAINLMVQFMLFSTFVMSFVIAIANISFTHYFDSSLLHNFWWNGSPEVQKYKGSVKWQLDWGCSLIVLKYKILSTSPITGFSSIQLSNTTNYSLL